MGKFRQFLTELSAHHTTVAEYYRLKFLFWYKELYKTMAFLCDLELKLIKGGGPHTEQNFGLLSLTLIQVSTIY